MIIKYSGSGKRNALLNLISHQPDIETIYLYAKDSHEAKYQLLINRSKGVGLRRYNDSKAFIEYSNDKDDIHGNIEEYDINNVRRILIVFDNTNADILSNKKLQQIVTELFIGDIYYLVFLLLLLLFTRSLFAVPKNIGLNLTYCFIMKISNKRELQQITFNHSSDTDFKDFMNLYKNILQNHILVQLMIILLHQITLYVLDVIFL